MDVGQRLKPGLLVSRFACLSARFSFNDFPAFLAFGFLGDLSAMWASCSAAATLGRSSGSGVDASQLRSAVRQLPNAAFLLRSRRSQRILRATCNAAAAASDLSA